MKGLSIIFLLFCGIALAQEKYPLPELTTTTEINGIKVDVKSNATASIQMVGDVAHVHVEAIADLHDFQNKSGDIVRAAINEDEECSHAISFPDVQLSPSECTNSDCQSAKMRLYGHYENKKCLFGREKTILSQSFDCDVLLFPEIANNQLQIRSVVNNVSAGGVLGKLMSIDGIKSKIVSLVENQMKTATDSLQSSVDSSFPAELKDFHPKFTSVKFQEDPKHTLLLKIEGEISVTEDQSTLILQKISAAQK